MTNINKQNRSLEKNAVTYSKAFFEGFHKAIKEFYSAEIAEVISLGFPVPHLALFGKSLDDVSLKVFISEFDFFLFFVKPVGEKVEIYNYIESEKYNRAWSFNTPSDIKAKQVGNELGITASNLLDAINVPVINRYLLDIARLYHDGLDHGNSRGIACGKAAIELLPSFKRQDGHTRQLIAFSKKYRDLIATSEKENKTQKESLQIGHSFENLWRDVLNFWDWQARKIELDGEKDDFTAMYRGNHIVGECRWVNGEQDADKVRAFAEKLNPRARSIGLMVAYNGFNKNALKQARRSVQSGKTLVLFKKEQIDRIILHFVNPDEVMDKELREVLDFLYEK